MVETFRVSVETRCRSSVSLLSVNIAVKLVQRARTFLNPRLQSVGYGGGAAQVRHMS